MKTNLKHICNNILNIIRPFYFNSQELTYKRMNGWLFVILFFVFGLAFYIGWIFSAKSEIERVKKYEAEERLVIVKNGDRFSETKLILFLKELNFKWPEIAYAQACIESGTDFNSDVNFQNNNYFGMKVATVRVNTQTGENLEHATYSNWRMSVLDYSLYFATYLSDFKTKAEYYNYLETVYCKTPGYVSRIIELERQYFSKLEKITAKNSYDIFDDESEDIIKNKQAIRKSLGKSIKLDSIPVAISQDSVK